MSLSTIFYFGLLWGAYRLGHFNALRPGETRQCLEQAWLRLLAWLKTGK